MRHTYIYLKQYLDAASFNNIMYQVLEKKKKMKVMHISNINKPQNKFPLNGFDETRKIILKLIFDYVGYDQWLLIASVCSVWKYIYYSSHGGNQTFTSIKSIACNLRVFKYFFKVISKESVPKVMDYFALYGMIVPLKYMHEVWGYPLSIHNNEKAIEGGSLEMFIYMRNRRCPWNKIHSCRLAIVNGHIQILKYIDQEYMKVQQYTPFIIDMIMNKQLDMLRSFPFRFSKKIHGSI